jgi:prepilin peptidase CpaA
METLMVHVAPLLLAVLLCFAVAHDLRSRRIPNRLVAAGMVCAAMLQWAVPNACAHLGELDGRWHTPLAGALSGLALLLPLYVLRLLGAGDVKLMGMVGAFVGPRLVVGVTVSTLVVGGVLALGVAHRKGRTWEALAHARQIAAGPAAAALQQGLDPARRSSSAGSTSVGDLPYAVAIAGGTVTYLGLRDWLAVG